MTPAATTAPASARPPGSTVPDGALGRYLTHPGPMTAWLLHHIGHLLGSWAVHLGPPVAGVLALGAVLVVVARHRATARLAEGARLVRVLAPPEVEAQGAVTVWTNLVALLRPAWRRLGGGQPHLAFELTSGPDGLVIAFWVPGAVPVGLVERAIEAAWPGAVTETGPAAPPLAIPALASALADTPLEHPATVTGGELRLAAPEHYPLATDHPVDPLRPLLGALSGLGETESACVQILARPVTGRRVAALTKAATWRRSGRPTSRLGRLVDLVTPGSPAARSAEADPTRAHDVAAILTKAAGPCWAVTVRYAVATSDTDPAAPRRLRGRAHAIASALAVFGGRNHLDRHRLRHPERVLAARRLGRGDLLSVAELAALAHVPTDVAVPGLARAGAKAVGPPPAVAGLTGRPALPGDVAAAVKLLGDAETGGRRPVALAVPDARYHLHVMGATGSGKSTLMTNLILADIESGRGVVVIDPKGDLVTDVCARLPQGAEGRTVLIDPAERQAPPIMNVLEGDDADLVVDNLVGIFRNIFAAFWGPRTDDVMRAGCLTLLRYRAATGTPTSLADLPRLLGDERFRAPRVAAVAEDAVGLGGFWRGYEAMSEAGQAQIVGPLMNKLRAFLLRDFVRQVVGRPSSSFDMGKVLDAGGVCLVRVPKGVLGQESAQLLGSFVVAAVWQAATHRARLGEDRRPDAALYVDECQNFMNLPRSFDELLAEARGYRLSMTLAHQHLAQLPRDLRDAVSSNARTKVWFSMSPEDAHVLARHTVPEVSEHDLAHLGAYQAAARLVVAGAETPAFTLRTRPATAPSTGRADAVRDAARAAFGRPVETGSGPVFEAAPEEMHEPTAGATGW
jgi:hypothetical protein